MKTILVPIDGSARALDALRVVLRDGSEALGRIELLNVQPRLHRHIAEKVARGEVEIAFHQITEMLPVAGVTILGPLPAELQKVTVYSGVLMKGARQPREAQALLDYLAAGAGRQAFLDRGFTAP